MAMRKPETTMALAKTQAANRARDVAALPTAVLFGELVGYSVKFALGEDGEWIGTLILFDGHGEQAAIRGARHELWPIIEAMRGCGLL